MANPSVTYTLSNGTTADASQVQQNFTDIINSLTDGTKSLSIDAITCAGTATFNGAINLGNGSIDDITVAGSLASSVPIKTNNSFDIGAAGLGLASVYLGAAGGFTTRLKAAATASYTLTLPATVGNDGDHLMGDGAGTVTFLPDRPVGSVANYGLTASVSSSALTINLKGADGNAPSSSNPVRVSARNSTAATGTPTLTKITSAMSIVVPSGATLGHTSAVDQYIYVYLIVDSTNELAVSGSRQFDEGTLQNATAITSGSTNYNTLYATSNHTGKPIRLIGRLKSNQATAGTWASGPTEISLAPFRSETVAARYTLNGSSSTTSSGGAGTTNLLDYNVSDYDTHSAVTTGAAWKFTAPVTGLYSVSAFVTWLCSSGINYESQLVISKNGSNVSQGHRLNNQATSSNAINHGVSDILRLNAGDYIQISFNNIVGAARSYNADTGNHVSVLRVGD